MQVARPSQVHTSDPRSSLAPGLPPEQLRDLRCGAAFPQLPPAVGAPCFSAMPTELPGAAACICMPSSLRPASPMAASPPASSSPACTTASAPGCSARRTTRRSRGPRSALRVTSAPASSDSATHPTGHRGAAPASSASSVNGSNRFFERHVGHVAKIRVDGRPACIVSDQVNRYVHA